MELRPIPGHSGYHADADGNIWSTQRLGRTRGIDGPPRLMRTYIAEVRDATRRTPYRRRMVRLGKQGGLHRVARLVCAAWHGEPPTPEHQTAHENGDSLDNRPSNLAWKTNGENQADRVEHGTSNRGEQQGGSHLTRGQVKELRAAYRAGGVTQRALAARYGVAQSHVSNLVNDKVWAWLD